MPTGLNIKPNFHLQIFSCSQNKQKHFLLQLSNDLDQCNFYVWRHADTQLSHILRLFNCQYAINVAANKDGVNRRASRSIMHERIASQVRTLLCWEDEDGEERIKMLVHQVLHGSSSVHPPKCQSSAWYCFPPFSHSLSPESQPHATQRQHQLI